MPVSATKASLFANVVHPWYMKTIHVNGTECTSEFAQCTVALKVD